MPEIDDRYLWAAKYLRQLISSRHGALCVTLIFKMNYAHFSNVPEALAVGGVYLRTFLLDVTYQVSYVNADTAILP
jgi:hypothetical protein